MTMSPIPCHIIAGPLGVGKTSAILSYLRRPATEQRVGVLVNDFGPVGLDGATVAAESPQTAVLNVPGGCIGCSLLADLPACIRRLRTEQELDRIIIEPSGMAAPAQVIDVLRDAQESLAITLRPVIVMLNAAEFDEETYARMAFYHRQYEAADVLVFNRCDLTSEARVERARLWARQLDPPKLRVLTTTHGELPPALFELKAEGVPWQRARAASASGVASHGHDHSDRHHDHDHDHGHGHGHDHGNDHGNDLEHAHDAAVRPGGIVVESVRRFDEDTLLVNLCRIGRQGIEGSALLRLKGVFNTSGGWQSIEIAGGEISTRPSAHRRDSRLEWLTQPDDVDGARMIEEIERPIDWQAIAEQLESDGRPAV